MKKKKKKLHTPILTDQLLEFSLKQTLMYMVTPSSVLLQQLLLAAKQPLRVQKVLVFLLGN